MTKRPVHKQTHRTTQKHAEHQEKNYLNYKKTTIKPITRKANAYFKQKVMNFKHQSLLNI